VKFVPIPLSSALGNGLVVATALLVIVVVVGASVAAVVVWPFVEVVCSFIEGVVD
jgi:hypothetical protein